MLPNPDTAVNTHVEGAEIPLQLHSQGKKSPFLPLTSMPDLPQNNFFLGKDLVCPHSPSQRPGTQKEHKKRGFSGLMVMALAPAAKER